MSIIKKSFGKTKNNIDIDIYTLTNINNMQVQIITYGASVVSIKVPDKNNKLDDVVLGYDNIKSYEEGNKYFGATIGRCCNRIEHGKFKINDKEYLLAINNDPNHLHGGVKGFDKAIWEPEIISIENNKLKLSYFSLDNEEGYPGNLKISVTYTLTDDNSLKIYYRAISDADTVVNLTNHSYFNLTGNPSNTILNHKLMINSDKFTENNIHSIPTGEVRNVEQTPMDFKHLKTIGKEIDNTYEQIKFGCGYDHNWILNANGNINEISAKVIDDSTGRVMELYTTTPCVQFYSANFLDGSDLGKNNIMYNRRTGLCLETQFTPNAINNSKFTSTLLKAFDEYSQTTIYKFSVTTY